MREDGRKKQTEVYDIILRKAGREWKEGRKE